MPEGMTAHDRIAELLPRLRRYARALTSSSEAADRLLQATLERAGEKLRTQDSPPELRVWLFGQMHETYVRTAALRELEGDEDAFAAGESESTPLQDFEQAIRAIPADKREVFLLVTLEDMTYDEVARALDIPIGTVMSRLSRAREKLRLRLVSEARVRVVRKR